jgi:undecaprenyl diphosphate synthase
MNKVVERVQSSDDQKLQEKLKNRGNLPKHIAIIMDGNGRWAKKRGLPRVAGHSEGVKSVRDIVDACAQLGIEYLTLYAFSTENWKRPKEEVSTLMKLLLKTLKTETDELHKNNIKLKMIGDFESLPEAVQKQLKEAIKKTENNTRLTLILALSYSGRWDILQATRKIADDVAHKKLKKSEINEETFKKYLSTAEYPEPDLLIRTSGEMRVSNFLLWEIAYTELYVTETLWPDFRRKELYKAIEDYQKRERKFGLVSEQIKGYGKNAFLVRK